VLTLYSYKQKSMLLKPLACPKSKARGRSYIYNGNIYFFISSKYSKWRRQKRKKKTV